MTAVEKAELARLRVATPTTIPAFAEARARRLAELEARFADAKERRELPADLRLGRSPGPASRGVPLATHLVQITHATVRPRGARGFLVSGKVNGTPFRGVVDFAASHGDGKILDLVTDFVAAPGRFKNLERDIIDAAAVRAGVVL